MNWYADDRCINNFPGAKLRHHQSFGAHRAHHMDIRRLNSDLTFRPITIPSRDFRRGFRTPRNSGALRHYSQAFHSNENFLRRQETATNHSRSNEPVPMRQASDQRGNARNNALHPLRIHRQGRLPKQSEQKEGRRFRWENNSGGIHTRGSYYGRSKRRGDRKQRVPRADAVSRGRRNPRGKRVPVEHKVPREQRFPIEYKVSRGKRVPRGLGAPERYRECADYDGRGENTRFFVHADSQYANNSQDLNWSHMRQNLSGASWRKPAKLTFGARAHEMTDPSMSFRAQRKPLDRRTLKFDREIGDYSARFEPIFTHRDDGTGGTSLRFGRGPYPMRPSTTFEDLYSRPQFTPLPWLPSANHAPNAILDKYGIPAAWLANHRTGTMCGEHALAFASHYLKLGEPNFNDPAFPVSLCNRGFFTDFSLAAHVNSDTCPNLNYSGIQLITKEREEPIDEFLSKLDKNHIYISTTANEGHHSAMFFDTNTHTWKRHCQTHGTITLTDDRSHILPRFARWYEGLFSLIPIINPFDLQLLIAVQKIEKSVGAVDGEEVVDRLTAWANANYPLYSAQ